MPRSVRVTTVSVFAIVAVLLMMVTSTMTSIVAATAVAATTALIMGGTGSSLSPDDDPPAYVQQYMGMAVDNYIRPSSAAPATGIPTGPYNQVAVVTPAQFKTPTIPGSGPLTYDESVAVGLEKLDNCIKATNCEYNPDVGSTAPTAGDQFVVFGYSESATIATLEKRMLAAEYPDGGGPDVSFELIGNGNRPNGGFLARGPRGLTIPYGLLYGGASFSGPTPTNTQYSTVDIAEQYDFWADVPLNPLDLVAMANWYVSTVHYDYANSSLNDPDIIDQGQYGDTHYYMIPQKILPLLSSVQALPVVGNPLADALDAPLRVLVEAGYNRSISPGQATSWNPLYLENPVKLTHDFLLAIPTGLDNAFEDTMGIRPFGTVRPGPYGVGGPTVTETDTPVTAGDTSPQSTTDQSAATKTTTDEAVSSKDAKKTGEEAVVRHVKNPPAGPKSEDAMSDEGAGTGKTQDGAASADDATADGKITQSTGDPKQNGDSEQGDAPKQGDVKHPPRHERVSKTPKETRSVASTTSTSAADGGDSKKAGPRHAR